MDRTEIVFALVVSAGLAALLFGDHLGGVVPPARMVFPLVAAMATIALIALVFVSGRKGGAAEPESEPAAEGSSLGAALWLAALLPALYFGGFVAGTAIYVFGAMLGNGAARRTALIAAAGMAVVIYGVFIILLQTPLPVRPLWMS